MVQPLTVALFGGFRLTLAGESLPAFAQTRLACLATYLLLHRGQPVSRQQLAGIFWPDTTDAQARTNLRNLIHRLNAALPDPNAYLLSNRHTIGWRADAAVRLDLADFEDALRRADAARADSDTQAEMAALRSAAAIYAGELFPDCYEDWIEAPRRRYGDMELAALDRLVHLLDESGQPREALGYAQQRLQADPYYEPAYRHLMRLYALTGDRTAVVRTYYACESVLRREVRVPLSDETKDTYLRCLRLAAEAAEGVGMVQGVRPRERAARGALRQELTSLVGREQLVERVVEAIASQRLVTLNGLGGVGKTRVAQRVAQVPVSRFPDGIYWVDLAPVEGGEQASRAIAAAVGARESDVRNAADALAEVLADKNALIVLDNCERLVEPLRDLVPRLLLAAPQVHVLVTSQQSLGAPGETTLRVPPLPVPPPPGAARRGQTRPGAEASPSVQLFVDRARTILATFALTPENTPAVEQICRRLSGIPLAIELAASRVRTLTPQQIAARLEDVFALLSRPTSAGNAHQQTLRAAMDWTHGLLSKQELILFRRLAVFAGPFTLESAEEVCAGSGLAPREVLGCFAGLEDKSLVEAEATSQVMLFRMHEVVRRYATERLVEAGELDQTRNRHLICYSAFVEKVDRAAASREEPAWLDLAEATHDNIRAAIAWSLTQPALAEYGLMIVGALPRFWSRRGYAREGLDLSAALVRATEQFQPSIPLAHALRTAGHLSFELGHYAEARDYYERALETARNVGHKPNIAAIVRGLGAVAHNMGDYPTAIECYRESFSICQELGDALGQSTSLGNLGLAAMQNGDLAGARTYLQQCLAIRRKLGDDMGIAYAQHLLADATWLMGRASEAWQLNEEALALRRRLGDKWGIAYSTDSMGIIASKDGRFSLAFDLFRESIRLFDEIGNRQGLLDTLGHLAAMLAALGRWPETAVLLAAISEHRQALTLPLPPHEQAEFEALRVATAQHLAADEVAAAMLRGGRFSTEEVAAYALQL